MNVLLLGADGFLGRHLQIALETAGHTVRRGVHRPVRRADEIAVDYARDIDPGAWRGRLTGIDAVINTVGILREGRGRRFDAIHDQAPRALFAACARKRGAVDPTDPYRLTFRTSRTQFRANFSGYFVG